MGFHRGWKGPAITNKKIVFYIDPNSPNCFRDKTSNILKDISGNGNHAVFQNGCTYTNEFGGGIVLDGSTSAKLSMPSQQIDSPAAFFTGGFSIEQIFKINTYQASANFGLTNQLISNGNASTYNYATQITDATTMTFTKRTSSEGLKHHHFTVPDVTDKVVHSIFVISEDGSTVTLYVNGVLINTLTINGTPIEPINSSPFNIGGAAGTTAFDGTYYACRIYASPLSASEALKNHNATKSRFL